MKTQPSRKKITTRAWTGLWAPSGLPGWRFSPYLYPGSSGKARDVTEKGAYFAYQPAVGETFYRVRVTVEILKDKRGRFITRKTKGARTA